MSTKLKLALFLVPSIAAILFLIWWRSPTQVILRRVDALLDVVEIVPLRLAGPQQIPMQLKILVAPELEVGGPVPIPNRTITRDRLGGLLAKLHDSVASCQLIRGEIAVLFPNPRVARAALPVEVLLSWGHGSARTARYHAELRFTKSAAGWHLDRIHLTERP